MFNKRGFLTCLSLDGHIVSVLKYGEVPASEVAAEVTAVGERTVGRYLAKMVDEGRLSVKSRGRGTVYWKPDNRNGQI